MRNFTIWIQKRIKLQYFIAIIFWLSVWQFISIQVGETILLVSPFAVIKTLFGFLRTASFWSTVAASSIRIIGGFFLALLVGICLSVVSASFPMIKVLLSPLMVTIKSIPVASFIILALLWLNSGQLAVFISFLMVLPIVYTNMLEGILSMDEQLIEMTTIFRIPKRKQMRYFYLPSVQSFLLSACMVGLGMCWKSGVAAEVIGITDGSIGGALYNAKIFLSTGEVFAWTVIIVVISITFEKLFLSFLRWMLKRLQVVNKNKYANTPLGPHPGDIILRGVSKLFDGQSILEDMDFCAWTGQHYCIMGASGRGKTTFMRIVMGLEHADQGEVLIPQGTRFSCQFQENRLAEQLSGIDNVSVACPYINEQDIRNAFEQVGFTREDMEKPAIHLSGGQKRRVSLIRAVLAESDVLILDEAFKGLDEKTKALTVQFINQNLNHRTFFMVTHEKEDAQLFNMEIIEL
ncbi:MAG: ATP-binding cassette domain-containing protein [Lachnospiraceae bacterium]